MQNLHIFFLFRKTSNEVIYLNESIDFKKIIDKHKVKPNYFKNGFFAFVFGGIISLIGQILIWIYENYLGMEEKHAQTLMIVTLILLASLLTGFGVYDKIGQIGGAGTIIPITGFSNSMTSAALEYKSEGIILGIASNMFKLAGSVIVFGVVSAAVFGIVRYLFGL